MVVLAQRWWHRIRLHHPHQLVSREVQVWYCNCGRSLGPLPPVT